MEETIQAIQKTPFKFFVAIAGGGQSFIGDYTAVSGASKNFVGGIVPYDKLAFNRFAGPVEHYASSEAARKLAVASYRECLKSNVDKKLAIGLGAASSIASEGERPGRKHKFFIAVHCYRFTSVLSYQFEQGLYKRQEEEIILKGFILRQLANAILDADIGEDDFAHEYIKEANKDIGFLINNETDLISSAPLPSLKKIVVYGGSFNPMHRGHLTIREMAEQITGEQPFFEVTVRNADKGFLDFIEVENRLNEIGPFPFILTNAPTIKEKVDVFKKYSPLAELVFVMGSDTWNRIWDSKYGYEPGWLQRFFEDAKTKFIVIPRLGHPVRTDFGAHLLIKSAILDTYEPHDLSSTQVRKEQYESSRN